MTNLAGKRPAPGAGRLAQAHGGFLEGFALHRGAGSLRDGARHAGAHHERRVGRVYDGVAAPGGDIALREFDYRFADNEVVSHTLPLISYAAAGRVTQKQAITKAYAL